MPEDLGSQYKSPILGPKKGFWVFRKSPKILTASDQYFLSYVKKTSCQGWVKNMAIVHSFKGFITSIHP